MIPAFAYNWLTASRVPNEPLVALTNVPLNVPPVLSKLPTLSVPVNVLTPEKVDFMGPSINICDAGLNET